MTDNRSHVIITGPAASGKTSNADAFMAHFGLNNITDDFGEDHARRIPGSRRHLVLTQLSPIELEALFPRATVLTIREALRAIGKHTRAMEEESRGNGRDHVTTCATAHLASDRMLLIIEKHGWPKFEDGRCEDALEWLERHADRAGPTQNQLAIEHIRLDPVPF